MALVFAVAGALLFGVARTLVGHAGRVRVVAVAAASVGRGLAAA